MPTPTIDWSDFDWFVTHWIPKPNKPVLALFGDAINEALPAYRFRTAKSDLKAACISKLQQVFQKMRNNNDLASYTRARQECERIMGTQPGPRAPPRPQYMPPPTFGGSPAASTSYRPNGHHVPSAPPYRNPHAGWAPAQSNANAYNSPSATGSVFQLQDWKPSPMWKPIRALSNMEMLPDIQASENSHTHKEKKTHIRLSADIIEKMKRSKASPQAPPHYSVRLFATSSDHFRPPGMGYQASTAHITNRSIPIEYPANPDVHVDDYSITFRERGLRGKAGSAPPFDLDKSVKGLDLRPSVMPSVTMGHTGPTTGKKKDQAKRFWFQVIFVEMTTKDELLGQIKSRKPTTVEETLVAMRKRVEEEDDIQFGTSNLSLKDTLSYMRITTPIRSSKCSHHQCFDAFWWLESNAQHPQWLCPLCNKELNFSELIVDGYFQSILNACPEDVDEVILEPGGEWHTEDRKYGSAEWLAENPPLAKPQPTAVAAPAARVKTEIDRDATRSPDPKGKRKVEEILLSSDDEDEPPLSRARPSYPPQNGSDRPGMAPPQYVAGSSRLPTPSTSRAPSSARAPSTQVEEIIDLTGLDSDDEDEDDALEPPRPPPHIAPQRTTPQAAIPPAAADDEEDDDPFFRQPDANTTNRDVNDLYPPQPLPTQIANLNTTSDSWNGGNGAGKESAIRQKSDAFAGYDRPVLNDAWRRDGAGFGGGYSAQGGPYAGNRYGASMTVGGISSNAGSSFLDFGGDGGGSNMWGTVDTNDHRWVPPTPPSIPNPQTQYRGQVMDEWEDGELVPPRASIPAPINREWVKSIWTPGQNMVSGLSELGANTRIQKTDTMAKTDKPTALMSPPSSTPPLRIPILPPFRWPTPVEDITAGSENNTWSSSSIPGDEWIGNSGQPIQSPLSTTHQPSPAPFRRTSDSSASSRHSNGWDAPGLQKQTTTDPKHHGLRHFHQYMMSNSSNLNQDGPRHHHPIDSSGQHESRISIRKSDSPIIPQTSQLSTPRLPDHAQESRSN